MGRRILIFLLIAGVACAQEAPFEVASIKPSAPAVLGQTLYNPTGGCFAMEGITAKGLVAYAYDVRAFQISGGPGWFDSDRFDVIAKAPANTTAEQYRAMVRGLLAERLGLKIHRESKEQTEYALVVAKGGAKLQKSAGVSGPEVRGGRGKLLAKNIGMNMLAVMLADRVLDRPVVDKTGLEGEFDITVEYSIDESPSIFVALQEQLGLRLESRKGPVEMVMIDGVERPSAN